jgi:uncharacterized protein (TIGR03437 family)
VLTASAYGAFSSIAPGTWIEIYGSNLAPATRGWTAEDFRNGIAPISLADVSVSIGGRAAYLYYVSPGQINALVPSDVPPGTAQITVRTPAGVSEPFNVTVSPTQPGLLAPPAFEANGKRYAAALFADGQTFSVPMGAIAGVASRPARPGETIILYGVGFGPVTGGFTAGTIVTGQNSLAAPVQFRFDGVPATPSYFGLAPGYTGLYQFNIVVPDVPDNDAVPLTFTLSGVPGTQTLHVAVRR